MTVPYCEREKEGQRGRGRERRKEGRRLGGGGGGRSRGVVKEKGKEDGERRREDFICSRRYHSSALLLADCNLREILASNFHTQYNEKCPPEGTARNTIKAVPQYMQQSLSRYGEAIHNRLYTFTVSRYSVPFRACTVAIHLTLTSQKLPM